MAIASKSTIVGLAFVGLAVPGLAQNTPAPWVAPEEERAKTNPVPASEDALRQGRALYHQHCTLCHGDSGRGEGPAARVHSRRSTRAPKDFSDTKVQAEMTDGEIFWKTAAGLREDGKVSHPAYRGVMSDNDLWTLVHFIRSLSTKHESP